MWATRHIPAGSNFIWNITGAFEHYHPAWVFIYISSCHVDLRFSHSIFARNNWYQALYKRVLVAVVQRIYEKNFVTVQLMLMLFVFSWL